MKNIETTHVKVDFCDSDFYKFCKVNGMDAFGFTSKERERMQETMAYKMFIFHKCFSTLARASIDTINKSFKLGKK